MYVPLRTAVNINACLKIAEYNSLSNHLQCRKLNLHSSVTMYIYTIHLSLFRHFFNLTVLWEAGPILTGADEECVNPCILYT